MRIYALFLPFCACPLRDRQQGGKKTAQKEKPMFAPCAEVVSILYATVFGAGEACVDVGLASILWAFGAFMALVVLAQFAARRIWARLTRRRDAFSDVHDRAVDRPINDDPNYRNSAVRSTRR
jgi:tellurite resistance protein TehA-like permease